MSVRWRRQGARGEMTKLDSLAREILADVLTDFRERNLGFTELQRGYEGASLPALTRKFCEDGGASRVDFDLAMKELETTKLVGTGPMEPYENDPNSGVVILAIFSKREYVHLTEKGYRAAQQAKPAAKAVAARNSVHISGGTFHHSPIGVGDRIVQSADVNTEGQSEVVNYLLELLARSGAKADDTARSEVARLVEVTGKGDLAEAKPIFQRLFGEATDGVKQVAWGVVSTIASKCLGL